MARRPLEGFTVGVTADRRWEEQVDLLSRRGAAAVHGPTISTVYLTADEDLRRATLSVIEAPPAVVVATTGMGFRKWVETATAWGLGDRLLAAMGTSLILARGAKAASAVEAAGLPVWARSPTEQMEDLLPLLADAGVGGRRVAVQEYGVVHPGFRAGLEAAGATAISVPIYGWRLPDDPGPALRMIAGAIGGDLGAITFTSAPAVHNLFRIAETVRSAERLRQAFGGDLIAACVGPVCAAGAREEGIEAPLAPDVGRLGLLVRALSDEVERRAGRTTAGPTGETIFDPVGGEGTPGPS